MEHEVGEERPKKNGVMTEAASVILSSTDECLNWTIGKENGQVESKEMGYRFMLITVFLDICTNITAMFFLKI
jgi:hypothetical protein